MGCTASKLENEDTVRRCKERRRLMKEAVYSRHHLAAAHSDYCRYLRLTGSALVTFASGEPLPVSHHTPPVLLRTPSTSTTTTIKQPSYHPSPSIHHQTPPPPPIYHQTPPPPKPPISTTSTHRRREQQTPPPPPPRRKSAIPVKLPHILSDSSFTSSPPRNQFTYDARANSTFSETASQTSSVWNWDNFYPPPSPPDSEYFQNLHGNNREGRNHSDSDEDDAASSFTSYSNSRAQKDQNNRSHLGKTSAHQVLDELSPYSSQMDQQRNHFGKTRSEHQQFDEMSSYSRRSDMSYKQGQKKAKKWESEEEEETEREEVQCSEWGDHDHDHYSSTSSSTDGEEEEEEEENLDLKSRSDFGSVRKEPANVRNVDSASFKASEKVSVEEDGKSSVSWGNRNDSVSERRMVVRHKDLREIVEALKEYFDKAAAAGDQVSEMLEIGRAQLDRNFKQLRKTVYHSSGMLSNLSSTWTSKPPLAVKYKFEPSSIEHIGGPKSLSCTLERLFAWEKKLYAEVKTREGVKIEHEKKLSALQNQEYRGEDNSKVDKTKASINRLHSLIAVTSQAVSTTSSAIVGLRDSDLVPQLVELCHGFMYMWRSMNQYHEIQNDIVQQVRGLVNRAAKGESTSDLHRQATKDLESAVTAWHSSFCRLIKFQRDFIHSLHGWFKLTLLPVDAEPTNGNRELSEVFIFCDEWKLALDRVPDTVASEAIKSFINVVHSIALKQTEEVKIRKKTETVSKELEKKASSLRNIEKKYYHSYSMVGIGLPDTGPDNGHALDARDPLAEKKLELSSCQRRVEDEMLKHAKAVEVTRAMTLNNIQTGLPGVFQAMTSFSSLITEALGTVCTRSYSI